MNLTTKFDLGQMVWAVRKETFRRIVNCLPCKATGKITINDEVFVCPKCGGASAYPQHAGEKCYIDCESQVGQVRFEATADRHLSSGEEALEIKYMLTITGIGSGQLWKESEIFATREEAQRYCDEHNGVLPQNEPGACLQPQIVAQRNIYELAK